ncbi:MAG: efflux RND transporter periplasmic adaptor subunit [Planctomycetales bacterium]|nr:efflux RND transporter periplasmic adaptor subunit [Planctomycetales bacterium]
MALGVATLLAGGGWYAKDQGYFNPPVDPVLTATVTRGELVINVTERGELESSQSLRVNCEIDGGGKLVTIAKEGTKVTKGEEVARFDTDALAKAISLQEVKCETADSKIKTAQGELEVQKNKADSEIAKADLALILADLDLKAYTEAEYDVELAKRKGARDNAKKDLEDAKDSLEFNKSLVKKGLAQPQQIRALELKVGATELIVEQQTADIKVLTEFSYVRKVTELKAKAKEAARELERTKKSQDAATAKVAAELAAAIKTADLEKQELTRLKSQLDKCIVKAPGDGIVIHFNHRPWDSSSQVRAGATLHNQQTILTLPDLNQMKVKLKVHESVVKKIAVGLTATMQVEALPNQVLHGTVLNVASVAQSDGGWRGGGVKEYETEVSITDLPLEAGLRPGMSAEVKILVKTIADALTVPVQAVTESDGKYIAYVVKAGRVERRIVKVGDANEQLIQVKKGLNEGEQVALDARLRAAAELKQGEKAAPAAKPEVKIATKIALATGAN